MVLESVREQTGFIEVPQIECCSDRRHDPSLQICVGSEIGLAAVIAATDMGAYVGYLNANRSA